jgi:ribonuclease J
MAAEVTVTFLGGLGDIGRNCAALEADDQIVLLDCGQLFPDDSMPGADSVLPDFSYLDTRADRIVGCIATHGHEDHVGALGYALERYSFPIYGSPFTIGMARHRVEEHGVLDRTELIPVADGERRRVGPFDCEFLPVTHSVPRGLITSIGTPQGVILHSSDFKLDLTPVDGRRTDLARIGAIATDPGVRLFLCDSTNADTPGRTSSETELAPVLLRIFQANAGRRVITACFSSHLHRVQQIIDAALATGRRITTLGLSMGRNLRLAKELGVVRYPDAAWVGIEDIDDLDPGSVCVISTGSQAEPRSALYLAAHGDSRWIDVGDQDTVVLSSHPIPGNEAGVARMIDLLVRRGAEVLHTGQMDLHTSGHGKQDELRVLHSVARPEWFVPVHGEYRHLVAHGRLAATLGLAEDRVLIATDGDQVVLADDGLAVRRQVTSGQYLWVHGDVTEADHDVFRERSILGDEGVVVATVVVDQARRELVAAPTIEARGWLGDDALDTLMPDAVEEVAKGTRLALDELGIDDVVDAEQLRRRVRRSVGAFVSERTGRRPMIVPVVIVLAPPR